jgi:hypothetical protein
MIESVSMHFRGGITATLLCSAIVLAPFSTAASEPEFHDMIGRWSCVDRDTGGSVWHFISTNAIYGAWLRLDAAFLGQRGQAAGTAVTFLGFDSGRHRWIISAAQSSGRYYVRSSTSAKLDGSHWIDAYPSDNGAAILSIISSRRYAFDFSKPGDGKKLYKSDVVCNKI